MPGSLIGTEVRRVEDPALLVGKSTFVDNQKPDGLLHLAFVRSNAAHAVIAGIDTSEAAAMPGVVAVLTGPDLGLPAYHAVGLAVHPDAARPPLAIDRVRFVGEAIAVVVAETKAQAIDAAEAVLVDLEPLPAVSDAEAALGEGAPIQFDSIGSNLVGGMRADDSIDALADAEIVVRGRFENSRMAVVPMEGNGIIAEPGDGKSRPLLTLNVTTQMPHGVWGLVSNIFGIDKQSIRVVAPHVGGGFGGKVGLPAEFAVTIAVARRFDRPAKWVETRSENMVSMPHSRGQVQYVELGLRRDGTMTGLQVRVVADAGAYAGFGGQLSLMGTRTMSQGVYRIPRISYSSAIVVTNTTPMGAFRGAGRPEAAAFLERIVDMAADELGMDPTELRALNFIGPDEFPYTTRIGTVYDSGSYSVALEEALRLAGYEELRKEQEHRRRGGDRSLLGIGISTYVEITAAASPQEFAEIEMGDDGSATIRVGTSAHGQGHATTFAMIVSDTLHVPMDRIRFVQSDTAAVPRGGGTGGSRSVQIGGSAVLKASESVLEMAKVLAADQLEADPADIELSDGGRFSVAGVPALSVSWAELASAADNRGEVLKAAVDASQNGGTFPFGAHVAVVEVDSETGETRLIRLIAVDDCGRIINPLLVRGQQHGGLAAGAAQALWEQYVYDADGNPLTSTLTDYAMPSAAELPSFDAVNTESPTPLNPLGAKGIGESATIGSTPAVQNAVVDAVSHLGVRHIDMPCTAEKVWRAIAAAQDGRLTDPWREPPEVFHLLPMDQGAPAGAPLDI